MKNQFFIVSPQLLALANEAEQRAADAFARIEANEHYNGQKVLSAFINNHISAAHLSGTTGYGYDDRGRDTLDRVFAQIFGCEDALVRHNFMSGTHALTTALFGVLRPGDVMVSLTGKPYDTLEEVIGIRGQGGGSLKDWGVSYRQVELKEDGTLDADACITACKGAKMAYLQRSRGYSLRPSVTVTEIGELCSRIKAENPDIIFMVDNCYGEFVEQKEPTDVGADLIVGSLIKNPGGGIAKTGGYIAGRADLITLCANRLSSPGVGREVGCSLDELRSLYLGIYLAPTVTAAALKTAVFAASLLELMGYQVYPRAMEERTDIITGICLGSPEKLVRFCQGIQSASPIDAFALPEPWDMPGYDSQVIMAAGAFTMGASIELSADAPMREPYAVWLQGGLTYPTGKMGILSAVQRMLSQEQTAL